jgi:hypothetical protein
VGGDRQAVRFGVIDGIVQRFRLPRLPDEGVGVHAKQGHPGSHDAVAQIDPGKGPGIGQGEEEDQDDNEEGTAQERPLQGRGGVEVEAEGTGQGTRHGSSNARRVRLGAWSPSPSS